MFMSKDKGWGTKVFSIGMGMAIAACQSSVVSSNLAPLEMDPVHSMDEAIADAPDSVFGQPGLPSSDSLVDGSSPKGSLSSAMVLAQPNLLSKVDSDSPALGLANHLTEIGAQMFGAYWCPHCQEQKKKFGDAFSAVDYVECDPGGENPRTQLCLDNDIEAFPTWIINDEHHLGVHSLAELAELSGYEGEI